MRPKETEDLAAFSAREEREQRQRKEKELKERKMKSYTVAETVVLPACQEMVMIMFNSFAPAIID